MSKHAWKKNADGEVDQWAWSAHYCNGVECIVCGKSPCVHCNPRYDEEECGGGRKSAKENEES